MAGAADHIVQWGVAVSPLDGQSECGDAYFAQETPGGGLFAVVDGLGHGAGAARAASCAIDVLGQHVGEGLADLVQYCHEAERGLRGVVMSIAQIDMERRRLLWLGVGNVRGVVLHDHQEPAAALHLFARPGIVGSNLPILRVFTLPIDPGDSLVLFTDGVQLNTPPAIPSHVPVQRAADDLLRKTKTGKDDALVFVARIGSAE